MPKFSPTSAGFEGLDRIQRLEKHAADSPSLTPGSSTDNVIQQQTVGSVPLVVKAAASATADLLQFQDSTGAVLQSFTSGGILSGGSVSGSFGPRVWGLGDSLTLGWDGNGSAWGQNVSPGAALSPVSYLSWAQQIGAGKFRVEGLGATGGLTTAQIITNWLPTVITAAPDACIVLGGTNDVAAVALATTQANLTSIWTQLAAAGTLPVLCTIPPYLTYEAAVLKINAWISRQAEINHWPLVDFYATLVDPAGTGGYLAANARGDGVHPSSVGAKAMGQAVVTALSQRYRGWTPWLIATNATAAALGTLWDNGVLLAGAANIPTGWSVTGAGATNLLATDASVVGNAFTVTRGANDLIVSGPGIFGVTVGHKILCTLRAKATIPAGGTVTVKFVDTVNGFAWYAPLSAIDQTFGWTTFMCLMTQPAGSSNGFRVQLLVSGAVNTALSVAQVGAYNLTASALGV